MGIVMNLKTPYISALKAFFHIMTIPVIALANHAESDEDSDSQELIWLVFVFLNLIVSIGLMVFITSEQFKENSPNQTQNKIDNSTQNLNIDDVSSDESVSSHKSDESDVESGRRKKNRHLKTKKNYSRQTIFESTPSISNALFGFE